MSRPGHGPRLRFGRVLLGLTALSLVAGCTSDGGTGSAPKARVDHATATAPAAPLADTGLVPGSLTESWHVDTPLSAGETGETDGSQPLPLLLDGQVVVPSSSGFVAYDASTGKERWHYREPGRRVRGYAATGGVLVAVTDAPDRDESLRRRIGLDARTGRILWTGRDKGVSFVTSLPNEVIEEMIAGGGVVPMKKDEVADGVFGVDARSGHVRWTHDHVGEEGKGCGANDISGLENDGSLLPFEQTCHGRRRVIALDPATGREHWRKDVEPALKAGAPRVSVSGGVALITQGTGFRLIAADGREVGTDDDMGCGNGCGLRTSAGHAVVAPTGKGLWNPKGPVLIVDTKTGRRTVGRITEPYDAMTVAGGRVYGLHPHLFASTATELLPSGLDVIDPATGAIQPRPLPFATKRSEEDPGGKAVDWMSVAGGRLYTRRVLDKTVRVTSYATTRPGDPAALGGVRASDWPDACHLVPGYRTEDFLSASDRAVTMGSTTLPNVTCMIRGDGAITTVGTAWVAATPEQAHALLTTPTTPPRKAHVDGADEAYSNGAENNLWIRVGRYVMRVNDFDSQTRIRVASAVAKELRKR